MFMMIFQNEQYTQLAEVKLKSAQHFHSARNAIRI